MCFVDSTLYRRINIWLINYKRDWMDGWIDGRGRRTCVCVCVINIYLEYLP